MTAEDLTQEDDGEQDWGKHWKQERAMQDNDEEARIAAAESAQWTWDNDPDERY